MFVGHKLNRFVKRLDGIVTIAHWDDQRHRLGNGFRLGRRFRFWQRFGLNNGLRYRFQH